MTSALNLIIPDLYPRLFDPEYTPAPTDAAVDTEAVWFPATEDEFDQMLSEFEAQDAELQAKGFWDALAHEHT